MSKVGNEQHSQHPLIVAVSEPHISLYFSTFFNINLEPGHQQIASSLTLVQAAFLAQQTAKQQQSSITYVSQQMQQDTVVQAKHT